ncbi:MAG: GGDEF domain-containing protein [Bacillota bacterium]
MTKLEDKLFKIIIFFTIFISLITIVGNFFFNFPINVNIKWIILIVFSIITYFKYFNENKSNYKFYYFFYILLIMIPFGWIDSGGSANNSVSYIFIYLIIISFLIEKKKRLILVVMLILEVTGLLYIENFYPELIRTHSQTSQFFDRIFQTNLLIIFSFLILKTFSNEYFKEKETLKKLASTDKLTNLYNRRYFEKYFINGIDHNTISKNYLIIIDIDHFKKVNDTYGHQTGDRILKKVATILKETFNKSKISRWGGDEFVVIFNGKKQNLTKQMDKILNETQKIQLSKNYKITLSCGITLIKKEDNKKLIFKKADDALYISKKNGRNQYNFVNKLKKT